VVPTRLTGAALDALLAITEALAAAAAPLVGSAFLALARFFAIQEAGFGLRDSDTAAIHTDKAIRTLWQVIDARTHQATMGSLGVAEATRVQTILTRHPA